MCTSKICFKSKHSNICKFKNEIGATFVFDMGYMDLMLINTNLLGTVMVATLHAQSVHHKTHVTFLSATNIRPSRQYNAPL